MKWIAIAITVSKKTILFPCGGLINRRTKMKVKITWVEKVEREEIVECDSIEQAWEMFEDIELGQGEVVSRELIEDQFYEENEND